MRAALVLLSMWLWAAPGATLAQTGQALFVEDFGGGLDQAPDGSRRWMTTYPFGFHQVRTIPQNHEIQCYTDASTGRDPFAVMPVAGRPVLAITAAASAQNPCGLPYSSGVMTTFGSFRMLYGYVEVQLSLPEGAGLWPAAWLLPADNQGRSELDIMERWAFDPGAVYVTGLAAPLGTNDQTRVPLPYPDQPHRYGVDWGPDRIVWSIDGRIVKSMATPETMRTPMYILLNLAIYGPGGFQHRREQAIAMPPKPSFPARMIVHTVAAYRTQYTKSAGPPAAPVRVAGGLPGGSVLAEIRKQDTED